ncbi:MAG: hypothetical protein ABIR06_21820 [Cyclobacteriaceae bacterium]
MEAVKQISGSEEMVVSANLHPKLLVVTNLFEALHENAIVYCNLKGNEQHLSVFITGESDIDILFDQSQKGKLELILHTLGFKKFEAIKQKQYKDIVDFLALDSGSGKVIHLHTYYRLTIGEPYLKGYQLDIENQILNSRVYNKEFGMYCIQPTFELILLYLIESLKLRHRDLITMHLQNRVSFSEKVIYQHNWLRKRTIEAEVEAVIKSLFKNYVPIYNLVKGEFNRKQLHMLAPLIRKEFARYRLYSVLGGLVQRWYRETAVTIFRKLSRIFTHPLLSMRVNPRGGIMVAITGSDSAMNARVTGLLKETFGKKLDVYRVCLGRRPDRNLLKWQEKTPAEKEHSLPSVYNGIQAVMTAREKSKNLMLGITAKKKGALVVCDYIPENKIMGHDGRPVLFDFARSKNPFLRVLGKMESNIYAKSRKYSPDLVFRLMGNDNGAGKVNLGEDTGLQISMGIKQPGSNASKTITVDPGKPLTEVLYIIKREIWNVL